MNWQVLASRMRTPSMPRGDTHPQNGRYGLREAAIMAADTETAKRALLRRRNTHVYGWVLACGYRIFANKRPRCLNHPRRLHLEALSGNGHAAAIRRLCRIREHRRYVDSQIHRHRDWWRNSLIDMPSCQLEVY